MLGQAGPITNSVAFDLSNGVQIGASLSLASQARELRTIVDIIATQREAASSRVSSWGDLSWAYDAQQTVTLGTW